MTKDEDESSRATHRLSGLEVSRQAEVSQPDVAVARHKNVLQFQVPVQDPALKISQTAAVSR